MKHEFLQTVLRRSNELALRARGHTGTNPNVGALIIDRDKKKIVSEDWHRKFGGPHAEINAIDNAKSNHALSGKAIAVSLEPCNHTGKTPACTKSIKDNHIAELWVDQIDPNSKMKGRSFKILRENGLTVLPPQNLSIGKKVIEPFRINTICNRPFLRLKMAVSCDHYIGQYGKQVKISDDISNRWVHKIRSETQAIMVGTNTLINDNPLLTSRYGNKHQPVRILPDQRGILPCDLKVFSSPGENMVLTSSDRSDYRAKIVKTNPHDLQKTLYKLYKLHIGSILVEGGSGLFKSLLKEGLWDELIVIKNNRLRLGEGIKAPIFPMVSLKHEIKLGEDTFYFLKNVRGR